MSPVAWGRGDLYTLVTAAAVFALSCVLHRKALRARGADSGDMLVGLMGSAMTDGPLLMILLDPLNKERQLIPVDLLGTVVNEARPTLWFAAFLALINTAMSLLRARA